MIVRDEAALTALLADLREHGWRTTEATMALQRAALTLRPSDAFPSSAPATVPTHFREPYRYSRYVLAREWRRQLNRLAGLPEES